MFVGAFVAVVVACPVLVLAADAHGAIVLSEPGTIRTHREPPPAVIERQSAPLGETSQGDTTTSVGSWTGPSPRGAVLRSAMYPGWGQLANGKRIKACAVFGVEAYFLGVAILSSRRAQDLLDQSRFATTQEELADLEQRHDNYINRRNGHIWWLGVAILYSMLDAYVDASLSEVEKGLSKPPPVFLEGATGENGSVRLGIGARF